MSLTVDAHVHLFDHGYVPETWHDATAWRWAEATHPARNPADIRDRIEDGLVDPTGTLLREEFDRLGIDAGVCLALDWGIALGETPVPIESMHEHFRDLQEGRTGELRGRFFVVAGVDPRRDGALDLLERSLDDWRFVGLKLYPPCGYYPDDPTCTPLYEACRERNIPVVIHTAAVAWPMQTRYAHPYRVVDVQTRFPELTYILAHAGHGGWGQAARLVAQRHPRTFLEISNWEEELDRDAEALAHSLADMRDAVGAHRILFGSDHFGGQRFSGPGSKLERWITFVRELGDRGRAIGRPFSDEELELILGLNAVRVFGLEGLEAAPHR